MTADFTAEEFEAAQSTYTGAPYHDNPTPLPAPQEPSEPAAESTADAATEPAPGPATESGPATGPMP